MKTKKIKITNKTDIKALAESYGLKFKERKAVCPFHKEEKGSLHLNTDNTLHCFGCGKHLNPKQFVYEMERLGAEPQEVTTKEFKGERTFKRTKQDNPLHNAILTDIINNADELHNSAVLSDYMAKRGINPFVASKMFVRHIKGSQELGFLYQKYDSKVLSDIGVNALYHNKDYKDQDFILLPYIQTDEVVAIKLRNLKEKQERVYLALGNIGNKVYNNQLAYANEGDELFITEGEIKTLALLSNGYKAIGLPSKNAFKRKNIELILTLNKDKKIILNFDNDAKKEGYNLKFNLKNTGYNVASLSTEKDIDEILQETKNIKPYILD